MADEARLIHEAVHGDRRALGELLMSHRQAAFALAMALAGNRPDAEDAAQEAFVYAVRHIGSFKPTGSFRAWLLKLVRSAAVDLARARSARRARELKRAAEAEMTVELAHESRETAAAVRAALAGLEERYRIPVMLHYCQGLSRSEVAEVLDLPPGTVATNVSRGVERLREALTRAGFAAAAVGTILAQLPPPEVPVSLAETIGRLVRGQTLTAASEGSEAVQSKGGLIMKIGLGVAAAGLVAGTMFLAAGGNSQEGNRPAEPANRFATPVTDPNAEWESTGIYSSSGAQGDLDGPRLDYMTRNHSGFGPCGGPGWSGNETTCLSYNPKLDRFVTAAGSAMGYLDGPFSRARFMGNSYTARGLTTASPDGRYLYITEPRAGQALRCLDLVKQEVRTLLPDTKDIKGLVAGKKGLYAFKAGWEATTAEFLVLDAEAKPQRKITLQIDGKLGGWGCATALDEEGERVYGSRSFDSGIPWYVWYWDLKDGSFHGLVPMPKKGDTTPTHQTGAFEGMQLYPELGISWVPDDPKKRFLYASVTDMGAPVLFDLVDREARTLARTPDGHVKWVGKGARVGNLYEHSGISWLPDGSFCHGMGGGGPLLHFRRIK